MAVSPMKKNYHNSFDTVRTTILEHRAKLDIYEEATHARGTGIICTIGPRSNNVEMLSSLMKKGMDVVRMNFSHGNHEYHQTVIDNARKAAANVGKIVAIALDTKGPEIRTGNFVNDEEVMLVSGKEVIVSVNPEDKNKGTVEKFFVDYLDLPNSVVKDSIIYIDDGLISLRVLESGKDFVKCVVENSGPISNHKGVNLPNTPVNLPALSEKDKSDLAFGVKNGVDMVFASFIRKASDVLEVRKALGEEKISVQIISKIENHEGVTNFDEILKVTDGVMVARGDLGIEIEPYKVFLAQKMMISKCMTAGKPVIVATQMLESMVKNPRPTRAEVSDVANAVLDGADCVMLSGETAKGVYPENAVMIMGKICREAEHATHHLRVFEDLQSCNEKQKMATEETVASSAVGASYDQEARAIIVLSNTGHTARLVAKYRPGCPVIAVCGKSCGRTGRQLNISRNVFSCVYDDSEGKKDPNTRVLIGCEFAVKKLQLVAGDSVVCVHADNMGLGFANLTRIIKIPQERNQKLLAYCLTTEHYD